MIDYSLWQLAKVAIFYVLIIFVIPAIVLYNKVADKKFTTRFFVYFSAGNFYIINLVYFLEIIHFSNRATLIFFTVVPAFFIYMALHKKSALKFGKDTIDATGRLAKGSYGLKNWLSRVFGTLGRWTKGFFSHFGRLCGRNIADILMIAFLAFLVWNEFGQNIFQQYGYCTSDIVVHNWWINELSKNNIFVDGVYPFGYHNIAYYLHAVFALETYDVLRIMWIINDFMIVLCLAMFLRGICKSKYIAYAAPVLFLLWNGIQQFTYTRYYNSLPQEYAMVFILPTVYFAIEFFEFRRQEVLDDTAKEKIKKLASEEEAKEVEESSEDADKPARKSEEEEQREVKSRFSFDFKGVFTRIKEAFKNARENGIKSSTLMLIGVACDFAMSISTHFYATFALGFLLVGIILGYFVRFIKREYFGRIMLTVFISFFVAILPMGISVALGKPLQGSLAWGMSVIDDSKASAAHQSIAAGSDDGDSDLVVVDTTSQNATDNAIIRDGNSTEEPDTASVTDAIKERLKNAATKIKDKISGFAGKIYTASNKLCGLLLGSDYANTKYIIYISVIILGVLAVAMAVAREYERALLNASLFFMFIMMSIEGSMTLFGLPGLMDGNRTGCFSAYIIYIFPVMAVDGVLYLFLGSWKKIWLNMVMCICSAFIAGASILYVVDNNMVRSFSEREAYQPNGSITVITNLIQNSKDFTWTLVSANDETQMLLDHGYHYELSEFLRRQEYYFNDKVSNSAEESKKVGFDEITIPTKYVYFVIEKRPIHYGESGERPYVSEEYAKEALQKGSGLRPYISNNRIVTMSKFYYWAQRFMEIYPNEMTVFYEDDETICYVIQQNEYSLYNFAIDYEYNMIDLYSEEALEAKRQAELAEQEEVLDQQ